MFKLLKKILLGLIAGVIGSVIGAIFGEGGIIIGFIIGVYVGFTYKGKNKYNSSSNTIGYASAKEDPNLTKFYTRSCNKCGKRSEHELARFAEGSPKAYLTCGACGHFVETKW